MEYDFHIGDYVKIKGIDEPTYITKASFTVYNGVYDSLELTTSDGNRYLCKYNYIPEAFDQIGKYIFVSQQKIEPLEYVKKVQKMATTLEFKNGELLNTKKGLTNIFEKISDIEIIDKINEIINYINNKENN